jgi:hypothetical protein
MALKRWKRIVLLGAMLSGAFTAGAYAQDVLQRVEAYLRPDFNIVINGKLVALEGPTLVYDDKSYLPLKEISKLLGANIIWKGDTQTIFINSLINAEQQASENDQIYEEIKMFNPSSVTLQYLGMEYPMLQTQHQPENGSYSYDTYYRAKDVRRMGVDTSGLKKSKERFTGELFINEKELQRAWKQKPTQIYASGAESYIIAGEVHTKKLETLKTYVKETATLKLPEFTIYQKPIMIEKLDNTENEYEYLFQQSTYLNNATINRFYKARLRVDKGTVDGTFAVNMTDRTDLESEAEKRANEGK